MEEKRHRRKATGPVCRYGPCPDRIGFSSSRLELGMPPRALHGLRSRLAVLHASVLPSWLNLDCRPAATSPLAFGDQGFS